MITNPRITTLLFGKKSGNLQVNHFPGNRLNEAIIRLQNFQGTNWAKLLSGGGFFLNL